MTAFQIPRPPVTAPFFRERKPKQKQETREQKREKEAPGYLVKVRRLPCCVCGEEAPSEPHHLKCAMRGRGKGTKVPNRYCLPLCNECHIYGVEKVGSRQEAAWFRERGILCLDLAAALFVNSHSHEAMLAVLTSHKAEK